jgi:hypothetical protein
MRGDITMAAISPFFPLPVPDAPAYNSVELTSKGFMDNRDKIGSLTWIYAFVLVVALTIFAVGIRMAIVGQGIGLLAAGCVCLVGVMVSFPISMYLAEMSRYALKGQADISTLLTDRLQQISVMLNLISEQQLLSDRAKSVAFREKDRDALRRAIQEEIARGDFEAATALANDIETVFGLKAEAQAVREEILSRRQDQLNKQIADAVATIDRFIRDEDWTEASRLAERLAHSMPDNDIAQRVPLEVQHRRETHKKQLIDSLTDAEGRGDYDAAIEILKKLDSYLTPAEAEGLHEQARGILKHKLQSLGNKFLAALNDNPEEAQRIGQQIMRDFPNSRIAQEVKEKMDKTPPPAARAAAPASA